MMTDLPWEDSLLERKTQSDLTDLLKTLVAFANSVRPGRVATILIGEKDDGSVQGVDNADKIQKNVRDLCDNKIYPPIQCHSQAYEKDGKTCVRVEIEYDGETPHFGGAAWVRRGSETIKATDEVFQHLIDYRLSKVRELAKWLDKEVTIIGEVNEPTRVSVDRIPMQVITHPRWPLLAYARVLSVNSFWATFGNDTQRRSEPFEKITLSWDDRKDQILVLVKI